LRRILLVTVLFIVLVTNYTSVLPVNGWAGLPFPPYNLHESMTWDALSGLVDEGLWKAEDIGMIPVYSNMVDLLFPHCKYSNHRVTQYQREFEKWGGDICAFPGAEWEATYYIILARKHYSVNNIAEAQKYLGYAIHYIQDAVCPPHVFPFKEELVGGPHWNFEEYTAREYNNRDWPSLVRNAPIEVITSPRDLLVKINESANWVNNTFQPPLCSYIREDGKTIGDLPEGWDWFMLDEDIGSCMVRAASIVKGAALYARFGEIPETLAIKKGLQWLRGRQYPDGSWSSSVGITSLVALAFLNAGYDETDPTVNKAIQYILAHRNSDGSFGWGTYETSTAVWALVATHNPDYHDELTAAKDWLIKAQSDEEDGTPPEDPCYGGWRYGISSHDGDLSNTQFALMALDAAYTELGLRKPDPDDPNGWAFKAIKFISRCQNRPASNDQPWAHDTIQPSYNDGGFIYHPAGWSLAGGTKSYGSMTAAGIWSLRLCGVDVADGRIQDALKWLAKNEDCSFDDNPGHPYGQTHCFLYYYYLTLAKALTMCFLEDLGGVDWYAALSTKLIYLQFNDGHWVNAPASHGLEDNPDLATSYAILSLQVRQIPTEIKSLSQLTIILRSNADLHVYDPFGRHVGKNYETGEIVIQIPNATYIYNEFQNITIPEPESGNYRIVLVGTGTGSYTLNVTGGVGNTTVFKYSYTGSITKGEVHESVVNVAMITWLTIYVEEPNPVEAMVQSSTGTGNVSFISDAGTIENLTAISESKLPAEGKPALSFPHGFFSFKITGLTVGQTVNVTIVFPSNIPVTVQYWKYHTPEGWYQIPIRSNDGDNIIIIQLTDGGIGDDDGVANGVIVDAGGPGVPLHVPKPPVGGKIVPVNEIELLALEINVLAVLAAFAVATALVIILSRKEYFKR